MAYCLAHGDLLHGAQLFENIQNVLDILGTTHQGKKVAYVYERAII